MVEHTPEAVAEALEYYRSTFDMRTYSEDARVGHDEVIFRELERVTALLQPSASDEERAREIRHYGLAMSTEQIAGYFAAVRSAERTNHDALVMALEILESAARGALPCIHDDLVGNALSSAAAEARALLAQVKEPGDG